VIGLLEEIVSVLDSHSRKIGARPSSGIIDIPNHVGARDGSKETNHDLGATS
jgi:hypothetical protein